MIKPKMIPVWMVGFAFAHFGFSFFAVARSAGTDDGAWATIAKLLSFPLNQAATPDRAEAYLFANSVLWALLFATVMIFIGRPKNQKV